MPDLPVIPDDELVATLAAIIRDPATGLSRNADCLLATLCACHLVERLADAGLLVVRRRDVAVE